MESGKPAGGLASQSRTPEGQPASRVDGAQPGRAKSRLIALGSAAVLAVYLAGYERTRAAAQQFGGNDTQRRVPIHTAGTPFAASPAPAAARAGTRPETPAPSAAMKMPNDVALTGRATAHAPLTRGGGSDLTGSTVAAAHGAPPVESSKAADASRPGDSTIVAVQTKPADSSGSAPPVPPATHPNDAAAEQARAVVAQWKDGSYTGWGTSRHGDIQAMVVVAEGKIVSAAISQCLTRYSCSWIAALPPQVVTRQSPEVDYVSGATQSTNAFYSAVVDALSKAK